MGCTSAKLASNKKVSMPQVLEDDFYKEDTILSNNDPKINEI